jgi:hypothetical protein
MYEYDRRIISDLDGIDTATALLPFLSSRSGYVREAAIARGVILAHADVLLPIAGRLNDWVPTVRDAARAAVLTMMAKLPGLATIGILHQIESLRAAARSDHSQWLRDFERLLTDVVSADQLIAGVRGDDVNTARACFSALQRNAMLDASMLIHLGLGSRHDIVMSLRAANMIGKLPLHAQDSQYRIALDSHFGAVRTVGIRALLGRPQSPALRDLAVTALLDAQSSVRGAAISYLRAQLVDVAAYYRTLLEAPSTTSAVIRIGLASLAVLRSTPDTRLVKSFLASPLISIRTSAYMAWLKLAESDKDEIATRALDDTARTIRKMALGLTQRQGAFIPFETACTVLARHQDWGPLLRFSQQEKWNALEGIARIALATGPVHQMRPELERALYGWMQNAGSFTRPHPDQMAFLRAAETTAVFNAMAPRDSDFPKILERELSIALGKRP